MAEYRLNQQGQQVQTAIDKALALGPATSSSAGTMSAADKSKLDSMNPSNYQPVLVSGTNIKTVNNQSILGPGNIDAGGSVTVDSALSSTSTNPVQNKVINAALAGKQATLVGSGTGQNIKTINNQNILGSGNIDAGSLVTIDSSLSSTSTNPVQNKVINTALGGKQDTISDLATIRSGAAAGATAVQPSALLDKQDVLVSGTNIKTVNNESILGPGNIVAGEPDAVKYTAQSLTTEQQQIARQNIGAASLDELQSTDYITVTALPSATPTSENLGHIYLVGPDANNNYVRYVAQQSGSTYEWVSLGTTAIDLSGKQDTLVSGTNIKTINNESILGSGNIVAGEPDAVKYVAQPLSDEQKEQARNNISAASIENFGELESNVSGTFYLGTFEIGSIAQPVDNNIPDFASTVRLRCKQMVIQRSGEYTISCNDGYEFLIYVVGKLTAVTWRKRLTFDFSEGDIFRIAATQSPTVDYSSYTQLDIDSVISDSGLSMMGTLQVVKADKDNDADLDIVDSDDIVLARFQSGHIKTRNFDSEELAKELESIVKSDEVQEKDDLYITDEDGIILVTFKNGHIQTKNFDSSKLSKGGNAVAPLAIDAGLPNDVPRVYIESETLQPNASTNAIPPLTYYGSPRWEAGDPVGDVDTNEVTLRFESGTVNFTDNIEINYQGHTSLADVKKAFSLDFHDKHKFGKWIAFDSFHLKAFYEDYIKCRDWVCNTLMEQIYMSRQPSQCKPFLKHNNFNNDYRSFFGSNAFCHVDGFPVELYINDVYWGVYIWRLKKDRNNYLFNKSDGQHIFLDAQDFFTTGQFSWTGVEVRNPKNLYCTTVEDGQYVKYDGDHPTELIDSTMPYYDSSNPNHVLTNTVKGNIVTWKNFMWGITTSTLKSDIEQHLDIQEWVDCYLLMEVCNVWDSWARNTLYGSWDGQHFAPMVYDMNNSFNGFGGKDTGPYTAYYPPTSNTYNQKARSMSWFVALESIYAPEIRSRYNELKEYGIFTPDNIIGLFNRFTTLVGFDAYGREVSRWPDIASYVGNNRDIDSISIISNWINDRLEYLNNKYQ